MARTPRVGGCSGGRALRGRGPAWPHRLFHPASHGLAGGDRHRRAAHPGRDRRSAARPGRSLQDRLAGPGSCLDKEDGPSNPPEKPATLARGRIFLTNRPTPSFAKSLAGYIFRAFKYHARLDRAGLSFPIPALANGGHEIRRLGGQIGPRLAEFVVVRVLCGDVFHGFPQQYEEIQSV